MILITHALTGAALGSSIRNPYLIAPLAIILHYCLDTFRHGEYLNQKSTFKNTAWKVTIDLLSGFLIILFYLRFSHSSVEMTRNVLLGTFFSLLPDLLTVLYWKLHFNFLAKLYAFHGWVHPYPKGDRRYAWSWRNSINDIIFSTLAIIILFI
jgi:hypothetical protein